MSPVQVADPMGSPDNGPVGVHLVGSIPLSSAREVFTRLPDALPHRLKRIPDGETGHRQQFTMFQRGLFSAVPHVLRQYDASFNSLPTVPFPDNQMLEEVKMKLTTENGAPLLEPGYDVHAIRSYEIFKSLQRAGRIPSGVRFQVSLPTPINVMVLIADGYQATIEPIYEAALLRSLQKIQASIPATDLAVQWDVACEFAMLEGIEGPHYKPFFGGAVKKEIVGRLARLVDSIAPAVECGLHLCYGDLGHRHFVEPSDTALMVEVAQAIMAASNRRLDWIHVPVPKDRTDDEAYFAPLQDLDLGQTELYLGLVHYDDFNGTQSRIDCAKGVLKGKNLSWGVGTECGMGRTPPEELNTILDISRTVSLPHPSLLKS